MVLDKLRAGLLLPAVLLAAACAPETPVADQAPPEDAVIVVGDFANPPFSSWDDAGNAVVEAAIAALLAQTKEIERAIAALDLKPIQFEGSDSLDNPAKVPQ